MSKTRIAVVTGANSGFGRHTVQAFHDDGWRVYATMRDVATRNARAAAELRSSGIDVIELDVTSDASVDSAASAIFAESDEVDVVVNNAGNAYFGVLEAFTPDAVEQQFRTNVFGPLRVNRAFLPKMRARKSGLVIYVSSVVGRLVHPFAGAYTASKWALEALAETASYELAPFDVDVAIVQPGAFATEIFGKIIPPDDAERSISYAAEARQAKLGAFFAISREGRDSADVATVILRLANAPAGSRPLRTSVPYDGEAEALNVAAESVQRNLLTRAGFADSLPKIIA